MSRAWKRVAERVIVGGGLAGLRGALDRPRSVVLAYHNIVPRGESAVGDMSLHIDQQAFAAQLDFIQDFASVVTLDRAVEVRTDDDRSLRVAITFDDAYRGTMTAGVEELKKRSLPATVFVPTALLGSQGFWWDLLSQPGCGLNADVRSVALNRLEGDGSRILAWAHDEGFRPARLPGHAVPVSATELLDPELYTGIHYGAHTESHANLAVVDDERLAGELRGSRAWLAEASDRYVDWLAFPYGLWNRRASSYAAGLFEGALRVEGGACIRRGRRVSTIYETPRVNVPRGLTLDGLALRLLGVL